MRRLLHCLLGFVAWLFAGLALFPAAALAQAKVLHVDFSRTNGVIRALHGINKGLLAMGGLIDLSRRQAELSIPFVRLHDCQWPYPEVVDIHAVFRDPAADPQNAASYDWTLTDAYLAAIRKTGAQIIYRLGESIEHGPVKRFVHPPADHEKWAQVCLGIIRHYNEGWAGGTRYGINYWEIWNEPENRPAMWSGTDEDYFNLYRSSARLIKKRFPSLKVGGPAVGYSGSFQSGQFVPSGFVTNFLAFCRRENLPLDFFSWHCYTADPAEFGARARAIRQMLDAYSFTRTESHLNEWNYLPGNSWDSFSPSAQPQARRHFFERTSGAEGAAFVTLALIELQEAPVQVCNYFHGELGTFGLFDEFGGPNHVFYALRSFGSLVALRERVATTGDIPAEIGLIGCRAPAGRGAVLIANFRSSSSKFRLVVEGLSQPKNYELRVIDSNRPFGEMTRGRLLPSKNGIALELHAPSVCLVELP